MGRFSQSLVCLALLTFVTIQCVSANGKGEGQPPTYTCTKDGYFADYYRACKVFYHCEGDVKKTYGCPPDLFFNERMRACVTADLVDCPYPA